eukprot:12060779-Karenia_brevis.AAC.1
MQAFVWSKGHEDQAAIADISALTDNLGNKFALQKLLTTKYPMCCVLMELAHRMTTLGGEVDLQWVAREQNQHADDLSKKNLGSFDPKHRVP